MATLYASTNTARKALIVFFVISIGILIFDNLSSFSTGSTSTGEEGRFYMATNRVFGDLPLPNIPSIGTDSSVNTQFVRESIFSTFPDVAYVYGILQPRENFQFLSKFEDNAKLLGFNSFASISGNEYSWRSEDGTKNLTYNSVSQIWKLETDLTTNPAALSARIQLENVTTYQSRLTSLIRNLGFDSRGMDRAVYDIKFLTRNFSGELITTERPLEADFALGTTYRYLDLADLKPPAQRPQLRTGQVFPQEFDGKVYSTNPRLGSFTVLFSNMMNNIVTDVFTMNFINFEYTQQGVYQIITPDEAFSQLQNGNGSLVSITKPGNDYLSNVSNAGIRRVSMDARRTELAYYEPQEWIGYTYPIYVLYGTAELSDGSLASVTYFVEAVKRV